MNERVLFELEEHMFTHSVIVVHKERLSSPTARHRMLYTPKVAGKSRQSENIVSSAYLSS